MFVFTAKLTKQKLIAGVLVAGLLLCGLILLISDGKGEQASAAAPFEKLNGISSNEDRTAFLSRFGWKVTAEPVESQQVLIPDTFEEVLSKYNDLQITQGFDLTKFKGKRVMRYSYAVENYPGIETGVFADLYIYKNTVIAGDVHSVASDGFMLGLAGTVDSSGRGGSCTCEHCGDPETPCACNGCGQERCSCQRAVEPSATPDANPEKDTLTEENVYVEPDADVDTAPDGHAGAEADAEPDVDTNADMADGDWFE